MKYEKHLITDKRFWPMFWTQFMGAFNDNVFKNAMVIMITFKAFTLGSLGSEQMVALCGGIFILPFFLFSALAGQFADKYPKHKLMYWIKVWELVVMLIGAVGFFTQSIPLLLITLFFMGLQSTFFGPVKYSVLPELVNEDELVQGNALVEMGTFVSILLGTILGGTLIALEGYGHHYVAYTVVVLAIIGIIFSKKMNPLQASSPDLVIEKGVFKPTWDIIKISKKTQSVWLSILGISWFWFLGAALLSIFPVYVKDIIKGDQEVVTLFLAFFSIGVAAGSLICEKLSKERLELGLVPFGSIGMTLFLLDLYFLDYSHFQDLNELIGLSEFFNHGVSYRILIDLLLFSIFSGFFIVPLYTFIQSRSEAKERSRVIAGNNIINALFMVLTSIFLTVLYSLGVSTIELFLIFAILNALVAAYIYTIIPEFLMRFTCMILTRLIYRLKVDGHSHIPDEGGAVLVCNHVSFIDWLVISASIKRPVRFVMYYKFFNIPLIKFFFKGAKAIPIAGYKEDPQLLEKAFDSIANELEEGEIICIFPEGKITADGELNPYRKGIEKIIERTPVPVIPMALDGLWGSFFSRKYGNALSKPSVILKTIWSKVTLKIGNEIDSKDVSAQKLEDMTRSMIS